MSAKRRIAILPDAVANRIAAGEVVERPSSVVKELIENAVDAGARTIHVEIESGGKTLIRIADDGEGMGRDDALLALDRHATSKVRSAEDLVGIATFGFRGEALPSIASVSRFELETAADGEPVGTRIAAAGGLVHGVGDIARTRGTTVTVRSLFHSTPARRKFLRSARAETRAALEVVRTVALARPDLAITVDCDSRRVIEALPASSLALRVAQVLGRELAETMVPVDYAAESLRVTGLVQRPADAAPAGRLVYLFVNGRPFRDHFLARAGERGYRATIHPGARPSLVLNVTMPPADVDVNVHPAKLEVRFRDRYAVEAVVEEAVQRALGRLGAAASLSAHHGETDETLYVGMTTGLAPEESGTAEADLFAGSPPAAAGSSPLIPAGLRILGQLHDAFILVEGGDALLIVDQHSAHERVLYERAMAVLEQGGGASQQLLFPLTLRFAAAELDALEQHRELIATLGYEVEPFGGDSVAVHAAPAPHPRFDAQRCLRELVADLAGGRFGALANRLERFAATFACRAAIKAGQPLSRPEMDELIGRLFSATLPAHDVHGRPTVVQLPRHELERRFGRTLKG